MALAPHTRAHHNKPTPSPGAHQTNTTLGISPLRSDCWGFVAFLVQLQPLCQKNRRLRRATRGGLAPPPNPPQPTDFLV